MSTGAYETFTNLNITPKIWHFLVIIWHAHSLVISLRNCCTSYTPMNSSRNLFNMSPISSSSSCFVFLKFLTKFTTTRASFCLSLFSSPMSSSFVIIDSVN